MFNLGACRAGEWSGYSVEKLRTAGRLAQQAAREGFNEILTGGPEFEATKNKIA